MQGDVPPPRVDHHQHLLSPAGAELLNRLADPVALPEAIERLLAERAKRWNDKQALAKLFTPDSVVLSGDAPGWIAGSLRGADFLSTRFAAAYRLVPTSYSIKGGHGHVAGYYRRGDDAQSRTLGYFHLTLDRARDGSWRIASEVPVFPGPRVQQPQTAADLVRYLDEAGIRRAVVLSDAYYFDSPKLSAHSVDKVRAENDWTAQQVMQFPERLVAFCSFNPLLDYALAELERCAASGRFTGIKLHFGTSAVDLNNADHVAKVRRVVEAVNRHRMPLIVHVRAGADYGREQARVLLDRIISAAPDVVFQIAHLWGGEQYSEAALAVYADAVAADDARMKNVYFDLAEVALVVGNSDEMARTAVARMRQIGMSRMLYGSDGPVADSMSPADAWKAVRKLPLRDDELKTIAENVAPYLSAGKKPP